VDAAGNLYITDTLNYRVRMVSPAGNIATIAGNGMAGYSGDGGAASQAQLSYPAGIAVDSGVTYSSRTPAPACARFTGTGRLRPSPAMAQSATTGDGGPATSASLTGQPESPWIPMATCTLPIPATTRFACCTCSFPPSPNAASNLIGAIARARWSCSTAPAWGRQPRDLQLENGDVPQALPGRASTSTVPRDRCSMHRSTQVAAIVPFELTGASAQVYVSYQGLTSAPITVSVAPARARIVYG